MVTVLEPIDHKDNFTNGAKIVATFARTLVFAILRSATKTLR
jgi:hypothetical protein